MTAQGIHRSPKPMVEELLDTQIEDALLDEASVTLDKLASRVVDNQLAFPPAFQVGIGSRLVLYILAAMLRPNVVVETGVADGMSTLVLLEALKHHEHGSLTSIDVRKDVARLLSSEELEQISLYRLPPGHRRAKLRELLASPREIDLFLHDSSHSFAWQNLEYELAWHRLADGGVLVSDDVDVSYAFVFFCDKYSLTPSLLFEGTKVVGAVQKGSS